MLNNLQFHARQNLYLPGPVMSILSVLSKIDSLLWLKTLRPQFGDFYFALAVENPNEQIRDISWNALHDLFASACQRAFGVTNGNSVQTDSYEIEMEIDEPNEMRDIVSFLWQVVIQCLRRSGPHLLFASKAFETGANMLRYVPCDHETHSRTYYKVLSATGFEEAKTLLKSVSTLAAKELFDHPVEENVLTTQIDYITLGWTRMLQAVLDLAPEELFDGLLPL